MIDPCEVSRPEFGPLIVPGNKSTGVIYFYGTSDGELVKIGYTQELRRRHRTHESGDTFGRGGRFTILALVRGCKADETRLKSYFKEYRAKGPKTEVFHAKGLVPYITWLRDQYFVSTSFAEFASETGQTVIDSQVWLPTTETVSNRRSTGLFADVTAWSFLPDRRITADDWYVPEALIPAIRGALGGVIDLDPASHVIANRLVKARHIYTKAQNGLLYPWRGRVYLNPPFDEWEQWAARADAEWDRGEISEMVMLGFTRTMTAQYFAPTLAKSDAIAVIKGRYPFWGRETVSESAPDGIFFMYRGQHQQRFCDSMRTLSSWIGISAIARA